MARRERGIRESRGPKYYCFRCQSAIDSLIPACPKHEPELHRKLTELRRKHEKRRDVDQKVEPRKDSAPRKKPAPTAKEQKK